MSCINKLRTFLLFFSISAFTSCLNQENEGVNFPNVKKVNCIEIVNDLALRVPGDFGILDSLFIIQDPFAKDYCFQIYNKNNGHLILKGAKKGQGPLEMITPSNLSISENNIQTYDFNLKRIYNYTVNLDDSTLTPTVNNWAHLKNINKIQRLGKNKYLAIALTEKYMFSYIDSLKNIQTEFANYPLKNQTSIHNFYDVFQGSIKSFDNGDSFVYAANNFPYFSIFKVTDKGFKLKSERFFNKPRYEVKNGELKFKKESTAGFMDVAIGKNSIFLLHSDVERYKSKQNRVDGIPKLLYEFDFEGRPLCKYNMDMHVLRIACDDAGVVYGISLNEEKFKIVKIKI